MESAPALFLCAAPPPAQIVEAVEENGELTETAIDPDVDGDEEEPSSQKGGLGISKRSWTPAEDEVLTEIVLKNGAQRWSTVASHLPGRMGKQCRERCAFRGPPAPAALPSPMDALRRWFNHLCPEVKKGAWTEEEDRVIMESVREYGTRWSYIVKMMPGRTDNAIKNRRATTPAGRGGEGEGARGGARRGAGRGASWRATAREAVRARAPQVQLGDAPSEALAAPAGGGGQG